MFSVCPIPVVSLHQHYGFRHFTDLMWTAEPKQLTKSGVGLFAAVSHSHTSAYEDVKAVQTAGRFVFNRDETDVVRVHIRVVHRRNCDRDFEPVK
jgi:hypothetical protein